MRSKKISKKGFSLIELMISAAILIAALLPVLVLFYNYLVVMEISRNTTIAVNDASFVLESMRSTDPFTTNNVVAAYPAGVDLADRIGPRKLRNETVVVSYQNPAADPLVITMTVSWQDEVKIRNRSFSATTMMTQR